MNLEAFLNDVLRPLVDHPEDLRFEVREEGRRRDIRLWANPKDMGRIIGKSGRMIASLRTLCQVAGEKQNLKVSLEIEEEGRAKREPRHQDAN